MDLAWRRVTDELAARGRNLTWLAEKLGSGRQRVYNWQARGVLPQSVHAEVAAALGKTPNWLAGLDEAGTVLSPMAREIVRVFERIEDDRAQLQAFVRIVEICAQARGAQAAPPTVPPAAQPNAAPTRYK